MKNRIAIIVTALLIFSLLFALSACGGEKTPAITTTEPTTTVATTTAPPVCEQHEYIEEVETPALALRDGVKKIYCCLCGDSYTEVIPATKSLKVLAIGNSFSVDATSYLWNICKNAGVEEVVVGSLYIGGCSLDTHYNNIASEKAAYTYQKNTKGYFLDYPAMSVQGAIADDDWDFITIQQVSQNAGLPGTFTRLDEIVAFLAEACPDATILWHMTWAYQKDSTHGGFAKYNNDQMTMYKAITDTVNKEVGKYPEIKGVIPSGTTIQNIRTSTVGDTLTRDGYHMSKGMGRYSVGVTWFAYLTGGSVDMPYYYPPNTADKKDVQNNYHIIAEAVKNALDFPFDVTQSQYY